MIPEEFGIIGTIESSDESFYVMIGSDGRKWLQDRATNKIILYDDFFKKDKWYVVLFNKIWKKLFNENWKNPVVWRTDIGVMNILHDPIWYSNYLEEKKKRESGGTISNNKDS